MLGEKKCCSDISIPQKLDPKEFQAWRRAEWAEPGLGVRCRGGQPLRALRAGPVAVAWACLREAEALCPVEATLTSRPPCISQEAPSVPPEGAISCQPA